MKVKHYFLPLILSAGLLTGQAFAQTTDTPDTQTQIEMRNEVPTEPAPAQNQINVDAPDAPDINITLPGEPTGATDTTRRETVTRDTTIIDDPNDADGVTSNSIWLYTLFGVLALFLVGMAVMGLNRNTVYED